MPTQKPSKDSDRRPSAPTEPEAPSSAVDAPEADVDASEAVTVVVSEQPRERAPLTSFPSTEPQLTAERQFSSAKRDPIVAAFLHTEKLRPGGIRKMARAEWLAALETFKATPRG